MKITLTTTLALLLAVAAVAAPASPAQPFHLQLEANPAAAFPFLSRFGKVDLHVYRGGMRAEALWLNSFSRNGDKAVTVMNPLGRMYVEMPIDDIAPTLTRLAGKDAVRAAKPVLAAPTKGKVVGIDATRYRLQFGPEAWVDYWTTTTLPDNPHLRKVVHELVRGISPATAEVAKTIPGTPLFVELNFRRFKKVPILYVKKLTMAAEDEEDALEVGPLFVRASVLEKLWD
jgi:hypothetical protein